jgi:hypothetical protein
MGVVGDLSIFQGHSSDGSVRGDRNGHNMLNIHFEC